MRKNLLSLLLVLVGSLIAIVSIYKVSLEGVFDKMGMGDEDYSDNVDYEALGDNFKNFEGVECGVGSTIGEYWEYYNSWEWGRIMKRFEMGEKRFDCGIGLIINENVKDGILVATKGSMHMTKALSEGVKICNARDDEQCGELLVKSEFMLDKYYLLEEATSGSMRVIIEGLRNDFKTLVDSLR